MITGGFLVKGLLDIVLSESEMEKFDIGSFGNCECVTLRLTGPDVSA